MCYVLLEKLANELASWNEEKGLQIHSKEKKRRDVRGTVGSH